MVAGSAGKDPGDLLGSSTGSAGKTPFLFCSVGTSPATSVSEGVSAVAIVSPMKRYVGTTIDHVRRQR
jgi:hypothetical protein